MTIKWTREAIASQSQCFINQNSRGKWLPGILNRFRGISEPLIQSFTWSGGLFTTNTQQFRPLYFRTLVLAQKGVESVNI